MTGRVLPVVAVLVAAVLVGFVLLRGGDDYVLHARFDNAGLLVRGGDVHVAGRRVGTITKISLADDGHADVALRINDSSITPLHAGTRAAIRAVGQAGVANRVVELTPGSARTATIEDGGVLPATQTTGIVGLDQFLDTFDAPQRASLQRLLSRSNEVFAGSGSTYFSSMLAKLSPALGEVAGVTSELAADGAQLQRLVTTARDTAVAVAARRPDLESALDSSARWLTVLADERASVSRTLRYAPAALRQGTATLSRASTAVRELKPALHQIPSVAPALNGVVHDLPGTLDSAEPVADDLSRQLPGLRRAFDEAKTLEKPLRGLLGSTTNAFDQLQPLLRPTRLYAPEVVLGVINGLAGVAVGSYDASGHYARLEFVQPPQTLLGGQLADVFSTRPLLPGYFAQKIHQTRRCPGGALPPAPDGSNVGIAGEPLCDPSMNMQESVNHP